MYRGSVIRPRRRKSTWADLRTNATGPFVNLSGTLNPDATGQYHGDGYFEGSPYFHNDAGYWLWLPAPMSPWFINDELDKEVGPHWESAQPGMIGTYNPVGGATGVGTLAYA